MATRIQTQLQAAFEPTQVSVENESWMYKKGEDTHFKVLLVSEHFQNKSAIERQRLVHQTLASEWATGLLSLSIAAKTPQEWEAE